MKINKLRNMDIKKATRVVIGIVFASLFLISLSSCSILEQNKTEQQQKEVVTNFIDNINDLNPEGVLENCDKSTNALYSSVTTAVGSVIDQSNAQMFKQIVANLYPSLEQFSDYTNVKFIMEPKTIELTQEDNTHATANVTLEIGVTYTGGKSTVSQEKTYTLIKEGESWKMSLTSDLKRALTDVANSGAQAITGLLNNQE